MFNMGVEKAKIEILYRFRKVPGEKFSPDR